MKDNLDHDAKKTLDAADHEAKEELDRADHEAKEELEGAEEASLKTTVCMLSRELLENSTGHGLERIVRAKEWIRSAAWLLIFILGMVWFCDEIYVVVTNYLAFSVTVSISVAYTPKFEFPAVTVCNSNMLKKKGIGSSKTYSSLATLDDTYQTAFCNSYESSCKAYDPNYSNQTPVNNTMPSGNDTTSAPTSTSFPPTNSTTDFVSLSGSNFTISGATYSTSPPSQSGRRRRASSGGGGGGGGPGGGGGSGGGGGKGGGGPGGGGGKGGGLGGITSDTDFQAFVDHAKTQDFSDLISLLKPTKEDLDNHGIQAEEFIMQCSFDQTNCSYLDFVRFQNSVFGNCYTFHPPPVYDTGSLLTTHYGLQYGLRLSLNIQFKEYIGLFSQSVGVRVSVHPFNVTPFPENDGVSAQPGMLTQVGVSMTTISRQPSPYPSNCTDGTDIDLLVAGQYTIWACEVTCIQTNLNKICGCQDQVVTNVSRCQISNSSQEICRQHVYYLYGEGQLGCSCPPSCYDINYGTSVNSMSWPSDPFLYILGETLMTHNPQAQAMLDNDDLHKSIVGNIVRLHVYIKDPNVYSIVEQPAYEWENMLADVGGLSGLCLGFSALSTFEFLEYFVDLFVAITKRLSMPQRHSQISPARSVASLPLDHSHTDLTSHQGGSGTHEYSA